MTDDRMAEYLAQLSLSVLEHGWAIQAVFPTEKDDDPPFAYTVGLTVAGLPELILSGPFPPKEIQRFLNEAASRHLENELRPGDLLDYLANVPFKVVAADANSAPIQQCFNYLGDPHNRRRKVQLLQIVWPDRHGSFPDDPGWTGTVQQTWPA